MAEPSESKAEASEVSEIESESTNTVLSLSTAGKYSYVTLTACLLATLFEDQREWNENKVRALIKHLELPEKVLPSVLAQMSYYQKADNASDEDNIGDQDDKLQISICEEDGAFVPLIETLKEDPLLNGAIVDVVKDLILNDLRTGSYDSRWRVMVHLLGNYLGTSQEEIEELENRLAVGLLHNTIEDDSGKTEEIKKKEKSKRRKRAFFIGLGAIGGGAVIALTGSLAAPFIAAGAAAVIGGGSGAVLGSTAGLAVITSLFGAAGAGLTGYRVKRRVGGVEEFAFEPLTNEKSLHLTIAVTGWLAEQQNGSCSFKVPWQELNKSKEQYCLKWESKYLTELGSAIGTLLAANAITYVTQEALMYTVLQGVVAAISWPLTLLQMGYVIDNPWSVCTHRAAEAGRELANLLATRQQGKRPVSLIGFSLGARVIYYCLKELADKKGCEGLIEDVVVLGAPVSGNAAEWKRFRKIVAGRIINGYCRKDWLLRFVYRTASVRLSVAGLQPITWHNRRMINVDLSDVIDGHLDYAVPDKMRATLDVIGIKTRKSEQVIEPFGSDNSQESAEWRKHVQTESCEIVKSIIEERVDVAFEVINIKQTSKDSNMNGSSAAEVDGSVSDRTLES